MLTLYGDLNIMKWLYNIGCVWDSNTFTAATQTQCLENLIWLRQKGCPWDEWSFHIAVCGGSLNKQKLFKDFGYIIE